MAESNNEITWESDNVFVPQYVAKKLKWFEKDERKIVNSGTTKKKSTVVN